MSLLSHANASFSAASSNLLPSWLIEPVQQHPAYQEGSCTPTCLHRTVLNTASQINQKESKKEEAEDENPNASKFHKSLGIAQDLGLTGTTDGPLLSCLLPPTTNI